MDWILFAIFFASCGAAAATGAMFQPGDWYDSLDKPAWTPPDWVFPVTWTVLYFCMATAAARAAPLDVSGYALAFWGLQLALNTLWTPIFFGLRNMRAGMIVIVLLWVSVAATMLAFWQVDWIAGALFVPYLIWVTIASALNLSVLRRNPGPAVAAE